MEARVFLRDSSISDPVVIDLPQFDQEDTFEGIRCPQCAWRPAPSSVWYCACLGTPEPPFPACGTVWNTFATHGRCPGCSHQWQWTTCLRCGAASLHEDWYEEGDS
jgi:DNA-directed RNA polymerase subunit RPC12/RpoP